MASGIRAPLLVAFAVMAAVAAWLWFRPVPGSAGEGDHLGQAGRPTEMDSGRTRAEASAEAGESTVGVTGGGTADGADDESRATPATPGASGTIHFEQPGSAGFDMPVNGSVAFWDPRERRLKVLLVDEKLTEGRQQQVAAYLRDGRLGDSGLQYALLDMRFKSDAQSFDRSTLESATLSFSSADGSLTNTADATASLSVKWGGAQPPGLAAPTSMLQLDADGSSVSPSASRWEQKWKLSVTAPVVQSPAQQGAPSVSQPR